jgi:hypothetical protein
MKTTKLLAGFLFAAALTASSSVFAQVKIGTNPMTIEANSNLEVEATNGNKTVIQKDNGNLGVGTATPAAKLHVNGNQILGTASSVAQSTGTSQVVRDNTTGELKVLQTTSANAFPFSAVTYKINNVQFDWINNFDTKVSDANYVVLITGLVFSKQYLKPLGAAPGAVVYNPLNFSAYVQNGTWRLSADYQAGTTSDDSNGDWTINCLIINKSIIQQLPVQTANLGGTNAGAMASAPAGL